MANLDHIISTIDAHTGGEPVRVVLSGLPPIKGGTMAEKKSYMKQHLDRFRTLLMREPRGHSDMFGAIITPPCSEKAQYGILFMDNGGYLDMCGHSIMGAATALIESGMIPAVAPETCIIFDTPAGQVRSSAQVQDNRVTEVSMFNVPSFLYTENVEIEVPEFGKITIDIAFGGNFFAAVDINRLGLDLCPANLPVLIPLGLEIKKSVNTLLDIRHALHAHIDRVELTEFYERKDPSLPYSKSLVVFGEGQFDRSPCGTGTSATMATLHAKGLLPLETEFVTESILGTRFTGKLIGTIDLKEHKAVEPVVSGSAFLIGIHQFVVDPNDPLKFGFKLE